MEERSATAAAAGAVAARAAATDDEDFDEAALRESNRAGGGRIGERVDRIAVQDGMRLHRRGGNARDAGLEGDAFRFGRVAARRGNDLGVPAIHRSIRKSRNLQAEGACGVDVLRRGRGEIALPFRHIDLHGGAACGTGVNRPRHVEAAVARVGERDVRKRRAGAGRNRDDIAVGVAVRVREGRRRHAGRQVEVHTRGGGAGRDLRVHEAGRRPDTRRQRGRIGGNAQQNRLISAGREDVVAVEVERRRKVATGRHDELEGGCRVGIFGRVVAGQKLRVAAEEPEDRAALPVRVRLDPPSRAQLRVLDFDHGWVGRVAGAGRNSPGFDEGSVLDADLDARVVRLDGAELRRRAAGEGDGEVSAVLGVVGRRTAVLEFGELAQAAVEDEAVRGLGRGDASGDVEDARLALRPRCEDKRRIHIGQVQTRDRPGRATARDRRRSLRCGNGHGHLDICPEDRRRAVDRIAGVERGGVQPRRSPLPVAGVVPDARRPADPCVGRVVLELEGFVAEDLSAGGEGTVGDGLLGRPAHHHEPVVVLRAPRQGGEVGGNRLLTGSRHDLSRRNVRDVAVARSRHQVDGRRANAEVENRDCRGERLSVLLERGLPRRPAGKLGTGREDRRLGIGAGGRCRVVRRSAPD